MVSQFFPGTTPGESVTIQSFLSIAPRDAESMKAVDERIAFLCIETTVDRGADTGSYGEYQIGEVYARSCVVRGTSGGISIPKNFASYAVQRGVGISITRT